MTEQNSDNTPSSTLPQRTDRGAERNRRRQRLLAAQDWCQRVTLENPRYRFRMASGLQDGSLNPSVERAILDLGWGRPQSLDKRLMDALGTAAGSGLINVLLRKALDVDPLAEVKPVEGQVVIDQPAQEPSALPPRASIVPPSRPRSRGKAEGTGKLGQDETELH